MNARRLFAGLCVSVLSIAAASPALALANRVFVSARSGNNANSCDNITTPCQSFAGAVTQLNPDGEVIVLDSGGYGPVTITQGVTIEAPAGVTAFVHPPSGDAITVTAGSSDKVTLRGLTLNGGTNNGITVNSVGTLNIENCFITGFANTGIQMDSPGRLNVKGTDIKACFFGVHLTNTAGVVQASIDHCHLDGNSIAGFFAGTTAPGSSTTTASYTTANNNSFDGWTCGNGSTGQDVLNLEFCTGSENVFDGLIGSSTNALSVARYSNCVFANNPRYGVNRLGTGTFETRGNNTITGNGTANTNGTIGTFLPM
jgi:parallel beta helix pectate lyase-like protein